MFEETNPIFRDNPYQVDSDIVLSVKKPRVGKVRESVENTCHPDDDYMFAEKECKEFNSKYLSMSRQEEQSRSEFRKVRKTARINAAKKCTDHRVEIRGAKTQVCKWTRVQ